MNLKILNKEDKKLLNRIEVKAEVNFTGATPSNDEIAKAIASELKSKAENVVVKNIYTGYGIQQAEVFAYVYDSVDSKNFVERKTKHIRVQEKKAEEEAKKAAEEAKKAEEEAKKAEEAKATPDEKPVEAKPEGE